MYIIITQIPEDPEINYIGASMIDVKNQNWI